ncbi:MAG TPA: DUF1552 domain-containing protein [Planctomycetes bacterium]|nr:DUF1552 domain-containing protein [Verrucomicrobiales bacterium]HIM28380.1 DUF1552 domain-containing protein [Planctomycetota bacterium]
MIITQRNILDRRAFLRGVGGAALALPHLNIMTAGAREAKVPMRMACVGVGFGFVPQLFFPRETGANYSMPELLRPLARHRGNFSIFSQLDHGTEGVGGHGGIHAYLSGILAKHAKGFAERNITVDQKAALHVGPATRYASMQFSTNNDSGYPLSWTHSGVTIPAVYDLETLFRLLFQESNPRELNILKQAQAERKSVLDLVRTDAEQLRRRVGQADQEKLDQYFTSVRELEKRLTQSVAWLDRPKPAVKYSLPEGADGMDFVDRVPLFYDLMALALQTDLTRVITLGITGLGGNSGGFPLTRGYHQLTHHGKVSSYIKELSIIEKFHTTQFGRFLDALKAIEEPNGKTLLDNTMTLFGSGMGNASSHSNKDLPLLLAGGGFKHGQHLRFAKDKSRGVRTPAANLFLSMLQRFGLETDKFNLATGTLTGLNVA